MVLQDLSGPSQDQWTRSFLGLEVGSREDLPLFWGRQGWQPLNLQ